ncbi:MAG: patatin family protein [Blautia sp.]|nr:patatin family protein [Blautia sp.]
MKKYMIGVVDVGGGMRGAYGAGIFDYCLDKGIEFDYLIGVSAGAANCCSYISRQRGRNLRSYSEYSFRKEYMSKRNLLRTGSYLDLEYIYGDGLTNSCGEDPLDFQTMLRSGKTFKIVATDADTGEAVYYDMHDMAQDDYGAVKGSSCVPLASKAYKWKGRRLYDGGLSDPIPFQYALDAGCEKVVIILTRPKDYRRSALKDEKLAKLIRRQFPATAQVMAGRAYIYNHQLDQAIRLEKEGKVRILAPYSIDGMDTLTRDRGKILHMYDLGMEDAQKLLDFL